MPEMQLPRPAHAPALFAFEQENRAYFAASIPDRGDGYFAHRIPGSRLLEPVAVWGVAPGTGALAGTATTDLFEMRGSSGISLAGDGRRAHHQGTAPASSKNCPVGPSSGRVASLMAIAAPCSGVRTPRKPLRSVAT